MRGRDAAGDPVVQPFELPQSGRDCPHARPGLAFQLHQVEFREALFDRVAIPQIGRQANLGQYPAVEIKGQAFHRAGAKIPAGQHAFGFETTQGFGHRNHPGNLGT